MIPMVIDTDPGIDDALALIYAFGSEAFNVVGLTTVFGNVPVPTATGNALWLLEWMGQGHVPVAEGSQGPLSGQAPSFAPEVHGVGGFGNFNAPVAHGCPVELDAADFLIKASRDYAQELVIAALGPLTNLAVALQRDPTLPSRVKQLVVMGGAFTVPGNVTEYSEANIYNDPDSAKLVLSNFEGIRFVGLDVTDQILLTEADCDALTDTAGDRSEFLKELTDYYLDFYEKRNCVRCASLHDPSALIAISHPDFFEFSRANVEIINYGRFLGRTQILREGKIAQYASGASAKLVRNEFTAVAQKFLRR
ncbi:MAG: nucleoside hydrolase [Marivivens sp.]|nr:nucleoside hydrolase [Marivivens sp.]